MASGGHRPQVDHRPQLVASAVATSRHSRPIATPATVPRSDHPLILGDHKTTNRAIDVRPPALLPQQTKGRRADPTIVGQCGPLCKATFWRGKPQSLAPGGSTTRTAWWQVAPLPPEPTIGRPWRHGTVDPGGMSARSTAGVNTLPPSMIGSLGRLRSNLPAPTAGRPSNRVHRAGKHSGGHTPSTPSPLRSACDSY